MISNLKRDDEGNIILEENINVQGDKITAHPEVVAQWIENKDAASGKIAEYIQKWEKEGLI